MRIYGCLLSAFILAGTASADPKGAWAFETTSEIKGCTITGTMTIGPDEGGGAHTCSFVSQETCEGRTEVPITIDQVCRAKPDEETGDLIIRSRVVASLVKGYDPSRYLPDHFRLNDISQDRMTGAWWDTAYSAPVIFWREKATPSS